MAAIMQQVLSGRCVYTTLHKQKFVVCGAMHQIGISVSVLKTGISMQGAAGTAIAAAAAQVPCPSLPDFVTASAEFQLSHCPSGQALQPACQSNQAHQL